METEEAENGNGKLKRKTEAEIGNGKAEIGKWSSTFIVLMEPFVHVRSVKKWYCNCLSLDIYQLSLTTGYKIPGSI